MAENRDFCVCMKDPPIPPVVRERTTGARVFLAHRHRRGNGVTPTTTIPTLAIHEIRVGPRHRKDLGDLNALASNIAEVGLLHPAVVNHDGTLIAGERRL